MEARANLNNVRYLVSKLGVGNDYTNNIIDEIDNVEKLIRFASRKPRNLFLGWLAILILAASR